jgi:nucleotide-binding universal stress UspA family protein
VAARAGDRRTILERALIRLKTILLPTDFSEPSRYALEVACALARDQSARVLLLHVLPRPGLMGRDSNVPAFKDLHTSEDLTAYRDERTRGLEALRAKAPWAQVETLLKEGDVAGVITRTAEEAPCDLIVLGSHGRSRRYQLMLGSVTAEVARRAPCPVVMVRIPVPQSQRTEQPPLA